MTVTVAMLTNCVAADDCPRLFAKLAKPAKISEVHLSKATHFVLSETATGKQIIKDLNFNSLQELMTFLNTANDKVSKELRRQLTEGFRKIDAEIAHYRGQQVAKGLAERGRSAASDLSTEEKLLAEFLAKKNMEPVEEVAHLLALKESDVTLKNMKFFKDPPPSPFEKQFDILSMPPAPHAVPQSVKGRVANFNRGMRECLANQTKTEAAFSNHAIKQAFTQLGVSQIVTFSAALTIAGFSMENLHVKELTINMFMTAVANGLGTLLLNGKGGVKTRFLQTLFFNQSLQTVSFGVFVMTPAPEGRPSADPFEQWGYNASWGLFGALSGIPLNDYLKGLACMYPRAKWTYPANIAVRTAYSVGVNLVYFAGEDYFLFDDKDKDDI